MIYTHVLNRGGRGVKSPVDSLCRRMRLCIMRKLYKTLEYCKGDSNRCTKNDLDGIVERCQHAWCQNKEASYGSVTCIENQSS